MSKDINEMFEKMSAKICDGEGRTLPELPNLELPELMLNFKIKVITEKEKGITAGMFTMNIISDHGDLDGSFSGMVGGPFFLDSTKLLAKMISQSIEAGLNSLIQQGQEKRKKKDGSPPPDTGAMPDELGSKKVH